MNKLLRGCEHDGSFIPVNEVKRLMQEYGKYCAEQAWAFVGIKTFNEWWAEFQRKEETK